MGLAANANLMYSTTMRAPPNGHPLQARGLTPESKQEMLSIDYMSVASLLLMHVHRPESGTTTAWLKPYVGNQ